MKCEEHYYSLFVQRTAMERLNLTVPVEPWPEVCACVCVNVSKEEIYVCVQPYSSVLCG